MHSRCLQLTARDRANLDVLSRDDEHLESAKEGRTVDPKESKPQRLNGKAPARGSGGGTAMEAVLRPARPSGCR